MHGWAISEGIQRISEDVLQANPDMKYIAGTAVTAEASIGLLRERGLRG